MSAARPFVIVQVGSGRFYVARLEVEAEGIAVYATTGYSAAYASALEGVVRTLERGEQP